jgi:hypothetical protein
LQQQEWRTGARKAGRSAIRLLSKLGLAGRRAR